MDYAQEELLRQRRVLAALLFIGRERMPRGETAVPAPLQGESARSMVPPAARQTNLEGAGSLSGLGAADAAEEERLTARPESGAAEAQAGNGARPEAASAGAAVRSADGGRTESRRGKREAPAGGDSAPQSGSYRWTEAASVGSFPVARAGTAAAGRMEARALSRAIQRDARRYDGSFTLD